MLLMYTPKTGAATTTRQRAGQKPARPVLDDLHHLTLSRLMEASEQQLENVARRGGAEEARVAQRILDCPVTFLHWEHEHARNMRSVAAASRVQLQKRVLLSVVLSLLHRKGLFEYLRDQRVHDRQREQLLMHFHGGNDYARSMVLEHGNYLRSAASYSCSTFIGLHLMHDESFAGPLDEYAMLYAGYFAAYTKLLLSQPGTESNLGRLACRLKSQLGQRRRQLLTGLSLLH